MLVALDVLMLAYTVLSKNSFRGFFFWCFALEEFLVLVWHSAAIAFYFDYYGQRLMHQTSVDVISHLIFWSYVGSIVIEFCLIWVTIFLNPFYHSHFQADTRKFEKVSADKAAGIQVPKEDYLNTEGQGLALNSNREAQQKNKVNYSLEMDGVVYRHKSYTGSANNSVNLNQRAEGSAIYIPKTSKADSNVFSQPYVPVAQKKEERLLNKSTL